MGKTSRWMGAGIQTPGFWPVVLLALGLGGVGAACTSRGPSNLKLVFPDNRARELVQALDIWIMEPQAGVDLCLPLLSGKLSIDGPTTLAHFAVDLKTGEAPSLKEVPRTLVVFFAQGTTSSPLVHLRGCKQAESAPDAEIVIELVWVCVPNPAGELAHNGLDDDCDGLVDECLQDQDCDDQSPCSSESCASGKCQYAPVSGTSGIACDDRDSCTLNDSCQGDQCVGERIDCDDHNPCTEDTCAADGSCGHTPQAAACDDGNPCTRFDQCAAGVCAGTAYSCDDGNVCTDVSCLGDGTCAQTNNTAPCNDGNSCSSSDRCGGGVCLAGPSTRDADSDGYVDQACAGGTDCRDDNAAVHPGVIEGPYGNAKCTNGLDDDCDGAQDAADTGCLSPAIGQNLLVNPGGESGDLSGWTVLQSGGEGWANVAGNCHAGGRCLGTSWGDCQRKQEIDLLAKGLPAAYLDTQPAISVGEWVREHCATGDVYQIQVQLQDASRSTIASWDTGRVTFNSGNPGCNYEDDLWQEKKKTFTGYGAGVRYVVFTDLGADSEFWAGQYGTHFDDAWVKVGS